MRAARPIVIPGSDLQPWSNDPDFRHVARETNYKPAAGKEQ